MSCLNFQWQIKKYHFQTHLDIYIVRFVHVSLTAPEIMKLFIYCLISKLTHVFQFPLLDIKLF
jgi:hypothetical protein